MASYNANINLLAFKQAQVFAGIDQKHPQRAYVCIPCDINEIKVNNNQDRANVRVNMSPIYDPQATLNRFNELRRQRGDDPLKMEDLHTHTLDISYSEDFVKGYIKAYGQKLIDKYLATVKNTEKLERMKTQDANDPQTELFKGIRRYMQFKLADVYPFKSQPQQPAYPQTFAQAGAPTAYVAPADGEQFNSEAYNDPDSDLPF